MSKKVIYKSYSWELTLHELLFGIMFLFSYLACGFVIHNLLDRSIENRNLKYTSAVWVRDSETFKNRLETDSRDAFVYGKWEVVEPVDFIKWNTIFQKSRDLPRIPSGDYSRVQIIKEHYTRHTRIVTYTDGKGRSHTRTEVYYTWDTVWNHTLHSSKIRFNDVIFDYDVIKPSNISHRVEYITKGNDRWFYYASDKDCAGIVFLHIENKEIGKHNVLDNFKMNTDEHFQICVDDKLMGNGIKIAFWVLFIGIGLFLIVLFFIGENNWLE